MTAPTTEQSGVQHIVWHGTGHPGEAQPVMEWLAANHVDGSEIPLRSVIAIWNGQIHFTRLVRALDGKLRVTVKDEPAMESATAPLIVPWPVEQAA